MTAARPKPKRVKRVWVRIFHDPDGDYGYAVCERPIPVGDWIPYVPERPRKRKRAKR